MLMTIDTVCGDLHNYFEDRRVIGDYTIENGIISLPFLVDGQYYRITGSKFNDGVHVYHEQPIEEDSDELTDEIFHGGIWTMNIPKAFVQLCEKIKAYNESEAAQPSPYTSENISGFYSYTRASIEDSAWKKVFGSELNRYRKAANIWV